MVGKAFKKNLGRILKMLTTREVSSIGVCGMGGVGKTTLAKHIHNQLVQQSQGRVIWVTVSQEFTVTSLQDNIAHFLGVDFSDKDDGDIRAARLHRALSQMKNSVLILDDVWEKIDLLEVGCPVSIECCRLIITTRSLEVCRQIRCQKVIAVEKLREDEAWKLFHGTLGNEIELGPQVEEIGKSIAKLCDGLPLGIITVAGTMRGETAIHTWINVLTELKESVAGLEGMGEDEVFKVLKYSFDRLNRNRERQSHEFNMFQFCFLYCSLYPEDFQIPREYLVRKWISEGVLDQRKSRRAQVYQGHSILDKLVNVCLLESCGSKCVKMHDLVRGMALKTCHGKYMVRVGDEEKWTKGLEKVSLMMSGIRKITDGTYPNCLQLSTLLLQANPLEVISDSFFSKMHGLCTLDLCGTLITTLPDSISYMKSLKALLLANCYRLEILPYLGKLKALRELDLLCTSIKEVPQGVEELLDLKFLSLDAPTLKILPRGLLLKLEHLQHVNIPFHIQVPIEEIENLKQLEEFSGAVKNVRDFNWFIRSRVHDTCYRIGVGLVDINRFGIGAGGSEFYSNKLIFYKCDLKDETVLAQDIVYLTIRKCEGLSICFVDDFSRFSNPTSLKRLRIESCGVIECILSSDHHGLPPFHISTLEEMELVKLEDLKGVIQKGEIGAPAALAGTVFSSLTRLVISNCNKTSKLGLPVSGVPNLQYIKIGECREIEDVFEDGGRGPVTLPGLKWFLFYELPRLKSVCKATMICNSIKGIYIRECPRLMKKLPMHLDVPPPLFLREMMVEREWWESLEWQNPNLPQLLRPFVQFF